MKTYVLPHIGQHPIGEIKPGEIMDLLKSIWHSKDETARPVLQRTDSALGATTPTCDKASPAPGLATVATVKSISGTFIWRSGVVHRKAEATRESDGEPPGIEFLVQH
jgi:hypothetical protein